MQYNNLVLKHFFNPSKLGPLAITDNFVASHRQGQAAFGDVVEIFLKSNESGFVEDAAFLAYGNPYLIASASLLCEQVLGSNINDKQVLNFRYFVDKLDIPTTKYYCAILVEEAASQCVKILQSKLVGQ